MGESKQLWQIGQESNIGELAPLDIILVMFFLQGWLLRGRQKVISGRYKHQIWTLGAGVSDQASCPSQLAHSQWSWGQCKMIDLHQDCCEGDTIKKNKILNSAKNCRQNVDLLSNISKSYWMNIYK